VLVGFAKCGKNDPGTTDCGSTALVLLDPDCLADSTNYLISSGHRMDAAIHVSELPPDFVASCRVIGERNADDVANFLKAFGIGRVDAEECSTTIRLPRELMLGLALVAELNRWEQNSITVHLAAGLPSSRQFLGEVMRLLKGPELIALVICLSQKVAALRCKHILWAALAEHCVEIAVIVSSDDDSIDAIADYLWKHRRSP
jgi:hypothetical protein